MVIPARTVAALSMSSSVGGWSEVAIQAAKGLTQTQRAKLEQEGVMKLKDDRPIRIEARPWKNTHTNINTEDGIIHKVIHFQRHGQGYHNLLGDMWREMGQAVVLDSPDPAQNPFIRPEIVDSPLTESGRQQCLARRPVAAALKPQAVIVSPLHRAVQTAQLSFADHSNHHFDNSNNRNHTIPWVAHEGCREDLGMLICNKRRPTSQIVSEFGQHGIDFSHMTSEEDDMWSPHAIETPHAKSKRVYEFLTDFIQHRPETELAVVTHSAWLFNMCNAVMDIIEEEQDQPQKDKNNDETTTTPLASWFLTSEIRSMHISFIEK